MEKQFDSAYTIAKLKEFHSEFIRQICCSMSPSKVGRWAGDGFTLAYSSNVMTKKSNTNEKILTKASWDMRIP